MFNIVLYKNLSERGRVNKTNHLKKYVEISGTLRDSTSILTPIITIQFSKSVDNVDVVDSRNEWVIYNNEKVVIARLDEVLSCNYVYIPLFKRYYYIVDIVSVRNGIWQISMSVDVLMSFKESIYAQNAITARTEVFNNPMLIDEQIFSYVTEEYTNYELNVDFQTIPHFSNNPLSVDIGRDFTYAISLLTAKNIPISLPEEYHNNPLSTPSSVVFLTNREGFDDFIRRVLDSSEEESSQVGFLNISDCINYIKVIPFSIGELNIMGGNTDINTIFGPSVYSLSDTQKKNIYVGGKKIFTEDETISYPICVVSQRGKFVCGIKIDDIMSKIKGDFTDYPPYSQYKLYIPYHDYIDINLNFLYNNFNYINFLIDPNTFEYVAYYDKELASWDNDSIKSIGSFRGNFAMDLGVGRTNASQLHLNDQLRQLQMAQEGFKVIGKGANAAISGITSGSVAGAASGIISTTVDAVSLPLKDLALNLEGSVPEVKTNPILGSVVNISMSKKPVLFIKKMDTFRPDGYDRLFGRPYISYRNLGDFAGKGFVSIIHCNYESNGIETNEEVNEILKLLINGVLM